MLIYNNVITMCNRYWSNGNTPKEVAVWLILNGYIQPTDEEEAINYLTLVWD